MAASLTRNARSVPRARDTPVTRAAVLARGSVTPRRGPVRRRYPAPVAGGAAPWGTAFTFARPSSTTMRNFTESTLYVDLI